MKAGRELDALVAEKVMGETVLNGWIMLDDKAHCPVEPYSTDIAAAWEVVAEMRKRRDRLSLTEMKTGWAADFDETHGRDEETAPLAICLAALRAVGSDKK